jgi:endonuclease/exonuclease/phosphatase family metal-dependent hydrolase
MPMILLGDLNEWLIYGRTLRRLVSHLYGAPAPRTYPARYLLFALARIWVHPGERLARVDVHRSPLARVASDRYPLVAELSMSL